MIWNIQQNDSKIVWSFSILFGSHVHILSGSHSAWCLGWALPGRHIYAAHPVRRAGSAGASFTNQLSDVHLITGSFAWVRLVCHHCSTKAFSSHNSPCHHYFPRALLTLCSFLIRANLQDCGSNKAVRQGSTDGHWNWASLGYRWPALGFRVCLCFPGLGRGWWGQNGELCLLSFLWGLNEILVNWVHCGGAWMVHDHAVHMKTLDIKHETRSGRRQIMWTQTDSWKGV